MAKSAERLKAVALRKKGESIKEIARKLHVSSGSVSSWVRDIVLTPAQSKRLYARWVAAGLRGRMMGAEANKEKKRASIRLAETEAKRVIRSLAGKELFFLGLGLYWGEGVKTSNGTVAIVNSDPLIIQIMMRWFKECWDIDRSQFQPRVFISNTHRDREEVITRFWMNALGLSRRQFRRMIFLEKGKKIYENRNVYYGVLTLRIAKGAALRHQILAHIAQVARVGIKPV